LESSDAFQADRYKYLTALHTETLPIKHLTQHKTSWRDPSQSYYDAQGPVWDIPEPKHRIRLPVQQQPPRQTKNPRHNSPSRQPARQYQYVSVPIPTTPQVIRPKVHYRQHGDTLILPKLIKAIGDRARYTEKVQLTQKMSRSIEHWQRLHQLDPLVSLSTSQATLHRTLAVNFTPHLMSFAVVFQAVRGD
jgi:hypothetical protein